MSNRKNISIVLGSDGLFWWTLDPNPSAASYHGTRNDSRGFKHRSEAEVAASFAADEADLDERLPLLAQAAATDPRGKR